MEYAVEIKGLRKGYPQPKNFFQMLKNNDGGEIQALNGLDLRIKKGSFFGVLGPNGAGKTTLTKILCTLIYPTSGKAWVNGYDVYTQGLDIRRTIGLVSSEERSFYWKLSGRDNLMFFALLQNLGRDAAKKRVDEVLKEVGMLERAESRFESYSSGMKQKMAIARGLLNRPEILFMDEPTRSLDPNSARDIRALIKEKAGEGVTFFLTTHNLAEAEELCKEIAILHKGRLRGVGSVNDLARMVKPTETINMLAKGMSPDKLRALRGLGNVKKIEEKQGFDGYVHLTIETETGRVSDVLQRAVELGLVIMSVNTRSTSLEKIFEELTIGVDQNA